MNLKIDNQIQETDKKLEEFKINLRIEGISDNKALEGKFIEIFKSLEERLDNGLKKIEDRMHNMELEINAKDPDRIESSTSIKLKDNLSSNSEERLLNLGLEIESVRRTLTKKIDDLTKRLNQEDLLDDMLSKEEIENFAQELEFNNNEAVSAMKKQLNSDKAMELYKRYLFINKQLERFKQLVVKGFKESEDEVILEKRCVTYDERIKAAEEICQKVEDLKKRYNGTIIVFEDIKSILHDKLKAKLSLDALEPEYFNGTGINAKSSIKRKPSIKNVLASGNNQASNKMNEELYKNLEDKVNLLWKEISTLAPKEFIIKIEKTVEHLRSSLGTKVDKSVTDSLEDNLYRELKEVNKIIEDRSSYIKQFSDISNKVAIDNSKNNDLINGFNDKVIVF